MPPYQEKRELLQLILLIDLYISIIGGLWY